MSQDKSPFPIRISLIAAAAAMMIGGIAVAQATPVQIADSSSNSVSAAISDTAITAKIKTKFLTDKRLKGSDISVETDNGVVKLTGKAPSASAKDAAGDLASNVSGVKSVDNNIKAPSVLTSAKKDVKSVASDVGQATSDTWITTKVKSSMLTDSQIKGDVDVTTDNGVVILTGTVPNDASRDRAVALAKQTKGVKDVNDDGLKVGKTSG